MMDKVRTTTVLAGLVLGTSMIVTVVNVVWLFESSPLEYISMPFKVAAAVKAGTFLDIWVERCNNDSQIRAYTITRELFNIETRTSYPLRTRAAWAAPGCRTVKTAIGIPASIPPGQYIERGYAHIEGHIKHFSIPWVTEPFLVTEKPAGELQGNSDYE